MELAKKVLRGSGIRVANTILHVGMAFYMMPFIIRHLGEYHYGLWALVGDVLAYFSLADMGLSTAVTRFVSQKLGQGDSSGCKKVVATSIAAFSGIMLVVFAATITLSIITPVIIRNVDNHALFRRLLLVVGFSLGLGFPAKTATGVLQSLVRHDIIACVSLLKLFFNYGFIILALSNGYGVMSLAVISAATSLFEYLFTWYFAQKISGLFAFNLRSYDGTVFRTMLSYGIKSLVAQFANVLRYKLDLMVLSAFIGLPAVTVYSIGARLIEYFSTLIFSAVGLITPVFSRYEGENRHKDITSLLLNSISCSTVLASYIGFSLLLYGRSFIAIWMGDGFHASYTVLSILCIPQIVALCQCTAISALFGVSKHSFYMILNVAEGIVNLSLSLLLVSKYGLTGVALGTAIPMFIAKAVIQPFFISRIFRVSMSKYYMSILLPLVQTLIPVLLLFVLYRHLGVQSYLFLFIFNGSSALLISLYFFFFRLKDGHRQLLLKALLPGTQ